MGERQGRGETKREKCEGEERGRKKREQRESKSTVKNGFF
jgi:hypothetical protein